MTDIRRTKLLTHRESATFIAFYLINGDQPLIQPAQSEESSPAKD